MSFLNTYLLLLLSITVKCQTTIEKDIDNNSNTEMSSTNNSLMPDSRFVNEYKLNIRKFNLNSQNAGLRPAMLAIAVSVHRGSYLDFF